MGPSAPLLPGVLLTTSLGFCEALGTTWPSAGCVVGAWERGLCGYCYWQAWKGFKYRWWDLVCTGNGHSDLGEA